MNVQRPFYQPDEADKKIIRLLLNNARMPVKEIAQKVFLSSPAVSQRIHHLIETGIITGFQTRINYARYGYNIRAFINLEVKPEDKPAFMAYIKPIDNIVECNCVTGDYSMLIEAVFRYTEELDHLINELQKRFGRTKTLITFSTYVEHRDLPL